MTEEARVAYSLAEAAVASGVSTRTIQRAIADGSIPVRYPTAKPVILVQDLRDWIASAPTQRSSR